jgi:N-acetylglucosaminyldiphosphoundecaprenol N-acetyl-beta-D-mannosaminyltransferase
VTDIKTINVMGYHVLAEPIEKIKIDDDAKRIINTINPHSYVTAKNDMVFQTALLEADMLLPDGSGKVLAAKQINKVQIKKVAGSDLHMHLLEELNKKGGSCFYMGARQETLDKIEARLSKEFPNIKAGFYSPPYRENFLGEENEEIIQRIKAFNPDVLFIGLTAPKQEKWLYRNKERIDFKIACCIGAVFDFYAGTVQRSSPFWVKNHMEWLPRLIKEPKRIWRRNYDSTPIFLKHMMLYKAGLKK